MNKNKILIVFLMFFLFGLAFFAFAQPLEIDYPNLPNAVTPQTTTTPAVIYFKYIFNLLIFIITTASGILILRGFYLIISAPSPEKVSQAKKSIQTAALGAAVLVSAWLILYTINPQLVTFYLPPLREINISPINPPGAYTPPGDLLSRIRKLAEETQKAPEGITELLGKLKTLTDKCDCARTKSICICTGGSDKSWCQPYQCYAGSGEEKNDSCGKELSQGNHPCPEINDIKKYQKFIVDWKDLLSYYGNRAFAESRDLYNELDKSVRIKMTHYQNLLIEEQNKENPNISVIEFLVEKLEKLQKEETYKIALTTKLILLDSHINKIKEPMVKIAQLPDQCLFNVAEKCKPTCETDSDYGCHDKLCGCPGDKCQGVDPEKPNPCPMSEIKEQEEGIEKILEEIKQTSKQIINIINNI